MRRKRIKYLSSVLDVIDEQHLAGGPSMQAPSPPELVWSPPFHFLPAWWGVQKERWLALVTACACQ